MEVKKICSAGDPVVVTRNRSSIRPFVPTLVAVFFQLFTTVYLFVAGAQQRTVFASLVFTLMYVIMGYHLNRKPRRRQTV